MTPRIIDRDQSDLRMWPLLVETWKALYRLGTIPQPHVCPPDGPGCKAWILARMAELREHAPENVRMLEGLQAAVSEELMAVNVAAPVADA